MCKLAKGSYPSISIDVSRLAVSRFLRRFRNFLFSCSRVDNRTSADSRISLLSTSGAIFVEATAGGLAAAAIRYSPNMQYDYRVAAARAVWNSADMRIEG
jgi:hypothetical protein